MPPIVQSAYDGKTRKTEKYTTNRHKDFKIQRNKWEGKVINRYYNIVNIYIYYNVWSLMVVIVYFSKNTVARSEMVQLLSGVL